MLEWRTIAGTFLVSYSSKQFSDTNTLHNMRYQPCLFKPCKIPKLFLIFNLRRKVCTGTSARVFLKPSITGNSRPFMTPIRPHIHTSYLTRKGPVTRCSPFHISTLSTPKSILPKRFVCCQQTKMQTPFYNSKKCVPLYPLIVLDIKLELLRVWVLTLSSFCSHCFGHSCAF